eukprot:Pgem_evm1s18061
MAKKPTNSGGKPWSQNMVEQLGRNGRLECVNLSRDASKETENACNSKIKKTKKER